MSETWYCFRHPETHEEVKIVEIDRATDEQMELAGKLGQEGYRLMRKQELGNTKKCKDNAV